MSNMYTEHIMDHFKNPRNRGTLEGPDASLTDNNPTCGDEISVFFTIKNGKIEKARQFTVGCAISQAGASMLFERLEGMSVHDVVHLPKEEILEEFGTELSVSRVKCALLGLSVAKKALVEQQAKQGPMKDAGGETPEYNHARD